MMALTPPSRRQSTERVQAAVRLSWSAAVFATSVIISATRWSGSSELLAQEMQKDPLPRFRERLLAEGFCSETEIKTIEAAMEAEAKEAFEQALATPAPDPSGLLDGVYASTVPQT